VVTIHTQDQRIHSDPTSDETSGLSTYISDIYGQLNLSSSKFSVPKSCNYI
jgi:hypothetical protein